MAISDTEVAITFLLQNFLAVFSHFENPHLIESKK